MINKIKKKYQFNDIFQLPYFATDLSYKNLSSLTEDIRNIINLKKIDTIFAPYYYDSHTDHFFTSKATLASAKSFRTPTIENIFFYETLSETNFNFESRAKVFKPNVYFNISRFFEKKISSIRLYRSELGLHPFPRSIKSIKSLALLRGSECAFEYAEAFQQIFSKIK